MFACVCAGIVFVLEVVLCVGRMVCMFMVCVWVLCVGDICAWEWYVYRENGVCVCVVLCLYVLYGVCECRCCVCEILYKILHNFVSV